MEIEEYLAKRAELRKQSESRAWYWVMPAGIAVTVLVSLDNPGPPGSVPSALELTLSVLYVLWLLVFLAYVIVYLKQQRNLRNAYTQHALAEAKRRREDASFTRRIAELTASLEISQRLIQELTAEVSLRKEKLEQLTQDAEEKERLASLHADEAAAVDARISEHIYSATSELLREQKRDSRKSLVVGGIVVAFIVGLVTNAAFDGIKTLLGVR